MRSVLMLKKGRGVWPRVVRIVVGTLSLGARLKAVGVRVQGDVKSVT